MATKQLDEISSFLPIDCSAGQNNGFSNNLNLNRTFKSCQDVNSLKQTKFQNMIDLKNDNQQRSDNQQLLWKQADKNGLEHKQNILSDNKNNHEEKRATKPTTSNSSTLSLHIAAYENSVEAAVMDDSKHKHESVQPKIRINIQESKFKNTFEFPRQQGETTSKPEVMQFKASQKLLDPNNNPNTPPRRSARLNPRISNYADIPDLSPPTFEKRDEELLFTEYFKIMKSFNVEEHMAVRLLEFNAGSVEMALKSHFSTPSIPKLGPSLWTRIQINHFILEIKNDNKNLQSLSVKLNQPMKVIVNAFYGTKKFKCCDSKILQCSNIAQVLNGKTESSECYEKLLLLFNFHVAETNYQSQGAIPTEKEAEKDSIADAFKTGSRLTETDAEYQEAFSIGHKEKSLYHVNQHTELWKLDGTVFWKCIHCSPDKLKVPFFVCNSSTYYKMYDHLRQCHMSVINPDGATSTKAKRIKKGS